MKNLSVKGRIALWITAMTLILSGLLLVFILSIGGGVSTRTASEQLTETVRQNAELVSLEDGRLVVADGFFYYKNGAYTLVYNSGGGLMAGQVPVGFTGGVEFEDGGVRTIESGGEYFLLLDLWAECGASGLWLRGLMQLPESLTVSRNLLRIAAIALPLFILLAGLGSYIIIRRAFRPLGELERKVGSIASSRDLSARLPEPQRLDEFGRLGVTFNGMFARLEKSSEADKRFASDASHELRTPVAIIKGACEYAEKYDETAADHAETLAMIHRQADKMSALIAQLLHVTRLEHGTEQISLERVDVGEAVEKICLDLAKGERLKFEAEPEVFAEVDRVLLARLTQNLVENGFRYGKPGGSVWVDVRKDGGECRISVRDDGIGIAETEREKIWGRFYQVDPARSGEEGSGLGLAIVAQIAEALGGRMSLVSELGVGSEFVLHLPLK